jgi:hypothetical protein
MTTSFRALPLIMAVTGWLGAGQAQPVPIGAPAADVLLSTHFRAPLTYEAAIARVDEFLEEQVGRKAAVAFPQIAPKQHFDLWHDMWVSFGTPDSSGIAVTIQRPADGTTLRLVKGWMLNLAGRLDAPIPLEFKEEPALHSAEGDLYAATRDVVRVLNTDASMKSLPTWQHAGLIVSAGPLASVMLAPAGLHGIHHITVVAQTTAAAKALLTRIQQAVLKPGIYAAYSEEAEFDEEIRNMAQGRVNTAGVMEAHAVVIPQMDPKYIENRLRLDPEMLKRSAIAQGEYDVRFRIDKAYHKVVVKWSELTGYSRSEGKAQGERALGQTAVAGPKPAVQAGGHLVARTRLEALKPGAYRVVLAGESAAGESSQIDERTFWFDGKTFEEL